MVITLPIPGFVAVIGFAVLRLSGDGVKLAPGLPPGLIDLPLFFLGKLLVGDEFFHNTNLLGVSNSLYHKAYRIQEKGGSKLPPHNYPAASSIFLIYIPYPVVGLFPKTWLTAPTSLLSCMIGLSLTSDCH